ncbi:hypothetical protein D9619_010796 [Psilocybe cf. subviscida]|uniref:Uncharacterized protein n=1 Tax=Psilocybe cf. subviscida TaxID=2480587 RepID=A0A8H5B8H4_9AGAR|nr:hypothetical protein D9619_010796 [Psilocybe cf. subviscida]
MTSIIIDDQDSAIIYSGSWFTDDTGKLDTMGNFGPPMLNTLHGTSSSGSLTTTFSGTQIWVTNSNQFFNPTGLNITCLIDNEVVPAIISTVPVNNVGVCLKDSLSDGPHTLVLHAVVTNQETFWFDYFHYVPSASVPLGSATLFVENTDEVLQSGLGTGWSAFSPGFQTTVPGSSFTYSFTGVSLIYYGFYDPSLPYDISLNTASYSIDGGSPTLFNTIVDAATRIDKPTGVRYNQILFQTNNLPKTKHTLKDTFHGSSTSTPLTLQFLVVKATPQSNGPSPPSTVAISPPSSFTTSFASLTSNTATPTAASSISVASTGNSSLISVTSTLSDNSTASTGIVSTLSLSISSSGIVSASSTAFPTPIASSKGGVNIGVIVGPVAGAIVVTAILFFFVFVRRWRQRPQSDHRARPFGGFGVGNVNTTVPTEAPTLSYTTGSSSRHWQLATATTGFQESPLLSSYVAPMTELTPSRASIRKDHVPNTVIQDIPIRHSGLPPSYFD